LGKIILDITMSLDGFIAGSDISPENPMGKGGEELHNWLFDVKTDADAAFAEGMQKSGAVILGGTTYRIGIGEPWGGKSPFDAPAFVLIEEVPQETKPGFTYVTDGIKSALDQAQAVAGDKKIWVMGGANCIQQYLAAGLFDELHIHIAPLILTHGTKLFENIGNEAIRLKADSVVQTPGATHLVYLRAE
jgi:dihydrofolate reductase